MHRPAWPGHVYSRTTRKRAGHTQSIGGDDRFAVYYAVVRIFNIGDNSTVNYADFSPFSTADDFHPPCLIDYTNQSSIEHCWIGDSNSDLPDLNTELQPVVDTMNAWIGQLVHNYSVDGLRVDTVKHVRQDFWPDFAEAAGVFTLGEVSYI